MRVPLGPDCTRPTAAQGVNCSTPFARANETALTRICSAGAPAMVRGNDIEGAEGDARRAPASRGLSETAAPAARARPPSRAAPAARRGPALSLAPLPPVQRDRGRRRHQQAAVGGGGELWRHQALQRPGERLPRRRMHRRPSLVQDRKLADARPASRTAGAASLARRPFCPRAGAAEKSTRAKNACPAVCAPDASRRGRAGGGAAAAAAPLKQARPSPVPCPFILIARDTHRPLPVSHRGRLPQTVCKRPSRPPQLLNSPATRAPPASRHAAHRRWTAACACA